MGDLEETSTQNQTNPSSDSEIGEKASIHDVADRDAHSDQGAGGPKLPTTETKKRTLLETIILMTTLNVSGKGDMQSLC